MGDPAGCGPLITARAWSQLRADTSLSAFVIGDPKIYKSHCDVKTISHPSEAIDVWPSALPVLAMQTELPAFVTGTPTPALASWITQSIETATRLTLKGESAAVVTNPISKAVLYEAEFRHPGHTEYLAHLCRPEDGAPPRPVMMLVGGGLRVALATIHMPLNAVSGALSEDLLIDIATIVHTGLIQRFGVSQPRLVFTGLNPHAGESGTIGREEVEIINPAARKLRNQGINISDARPADTVFAEAISGQFDAIIAMTHDQGLIPVKTLDLWGGVNCTLGLPFIRTSPDHGTAYDAAAGGTARPDSLIAAIRLAASMAAQS